ncbi:MAG: SDR family oxidoreductase [Chloroflexi bacterium]|nr:SDR family oxidoreductase [Chloroflexota bacterium]
MNLSGKVAIVTGGSRMTGREIARALLCREARVLVCARGEDRLAEAVLDLQHASPTVVGVAGDVGDESDVCRIVERAVGEFGGVDILVNNAALGGGGRTEQCSPEHWDAVFRTNVRGPFLLARQVVPIMRRRGAGAIVSIGSGAGKQGYAGMPAYSASKFALLGFSQSLAQEVSDDNIKVSVINPGTIRDPQRSGPAPAGMKYLLAADVAEAVIALLSQSDRAWTQEMSLWPFRGD